MGQFSDENALENFGVRAPVVTRLVSEFEEGTVQVLIVFSKLNPSYLSSIHISYDKLK